MITFIVSENTSMDIELAPHALSEHWHKAAASLNIFDTRNSISLYQYHTGTITRYKAATYWGRAAILNEAKC